MYIRRAAIKSRKDGGQYYTYRLVESRRTEEGVRQHTLLNLGVDFSLPREQWPDLVKRIEEILGGQSSLFDIDSEVERLAQRYSSRLVLSHQDVNASDVIDYREVDLDSIEMSKPRSVGREHVTLEVLQYFQGLIKNWESLVSMDRRLLLPLGQSLAGPVSQGVNWQRTGGSRSDQD